MIKRVSYYVIVFGLLIQASCKKLGLCEDDRLNIEKTNYFGNQLKIRGYYLEQLPMATEPYVDIKFFYEHGVILGYQGSNNEDINSGIVDIDRINTGLKSKAAWGLFHISGNMIEIEQWTPSATGCFNTWYEQGEILNDTSFVINRVEYRNGGVAERVETVNQVYRFYKLDTKPDSTNTFIK
jgi:hypothetical protein